jgi:hypothetical protein
MGLRKLIKEKESLEEALYELHYLELPPALYKQTRHSIEYKIVCLEEQIEFEERFRPFRITLIIASFIMMGIMVYAIIKS